jgi:hypothetical protein
VTVHVLRHDDRVVDHDPGNADQRDQSHTVQRVAERDDEEGQREGDRYRHDDQTGAPTHRERDDDPHGEDRQQEVLLQRVDLVPRGPP